MHTKPNDVVTKTLTTSYRTDLSTPVLNLVRADPVGSGSVPNRLQIGSPPHCMNVPQRTLQAKKQEKISEK